jgi:GNAT superfamily N-acetyltransferase
MDYEHRIGLEYLEAVTTLSQRVRAAHPTAGQYEAADFQWWWRTPRPTDEIPQPFWFDDSGRPEAAVIATDWGNGIALAPILMPDATPDWVAHVVEHGLGHFAELGIEAVDLEVDRDDALMRDLLTNEGFTPEGTGSDDTSASHSVVEAWMAADSLPEINPLHAGYRLLRRHDTPPWPHHMAKRGGPAVEKRLRQTSLYRPDLDLVIVDSDNRYAAYALFWHDPATATGLVEPMRTEADHQRRGLARHLLTTGVDLLARSGAERIKICFEPDNTAAKALYAGVGFEPVGETMIFSRGAG